MAIGWLLYSTQTKWVNGGKSVEEFPRGLSHSADAGFGTAQSRYLGKEVNGNRQGNYVSDCILTDRVEPYGVIRPAQLWRAPFWREEIWPTTTAPVLEDELDVGPLDTDAIADWLHQDPKRITGLERLLTVLEDPSGTRVIIRSEHPVAALYWIAASTILLPIREALAVSFRVFANNIDDAPHRILAVPSDLYPNLAPGSRPKTFIVDASTNMTDDVEPSARAKFWVRQLNEAAEPYDVVEAVAMAAAFGGATEQELSDSRHGAMAVVDPGHVIEDALGVGRWVRRTIATQHDDAAQSVLSRLIAADDVRIDDLRLLDDLAGEGTVAVEPSQLRCRLLNAELELVTAGVPSPNGQLRPAALDRVQRSDSESAVVSAMLVGSDSTMDSLLRLAWRHRLTLAPPSPALVDRIRTFVSDWLKTPNAAYRVSDWALRDLIVDELHGQLRGVCASGDMTTLARVLRATILEMIRRPNDLTDAFTFEIEGCYTATLKPLGRIERTRAILRSLEVAGTDDGFSGYQDALVRWHAVDPETSLDIVGRIPPTFRLNETIGKMASRELISRADKVDEKLIRTIEGLSVHNALPDRPRLHRLARSAAAIATLLDWLDKIQSAADMQGAGDELQTLHEADDEVIELSIPALVAASFTGPYREIGQSILRFLRDGPAVSFARTWARYLNDSKSGRIAAAYAVTWAGDKSISAGARHELGQKVVAHYTNLRAEDAAAWRTSVTNHLRNGSARATLEELLDGETMSKSRGPRLRRKS
jgi:hypothetical protein